MQKEKMSIVYIQGSMAGMADKPPFIACHRAGSALTHPTSIILTKSLAGKLFPEGEALNRSVDILLSKINLSTGQMNQNLNHFLLGAVIKDPPTNTHLQFELLALGTLLTKDLVPFLFLFTVAVGLVAGIYPAYHFSMHEPSSVLKGKFFFGGKKPWLRITLVTFQFAISVFLLIAVWIVNNGYRYWVYWLDRPHKLSDARTKKRNLHKKSFRSKLFKNNGSSSNRYAEMGVACQPDCIAHGLVCCRSLAG